MVEPSSDGVYGGANKLFHSPWVILNDFGGAFSMGAVGGGIWYGIKGARNSPRVGVYLSHFFSLKSDLCTG